MKKKLLFALLSLLLLPLGVMAQDVTVRSNNGNTIPAVKQSGGNSTDDTFYRNNGFAMWKHNQLNLTMTTADKDEYFKLTDYKQFKNPANNIFKSPVAGSTNLVIGRGRYQDSYVAFTLPKGYRFTRYVITFRRNVNMNSVWTFSDYGDADGDDGNASFGEVVKGADGNVDWDWYSDDTHKTNLAYNSGRQTITRQGNEEEMDNALYFKLTNTGDNRCFIALESVTLYFTAEADYTPMTPAGSFLKKHAVDIPFSTSTVDIGTVEERTYNGGKRISYDFNQVKDLMGNLTLFEAEAVKAGTNYDGVSGNLVDPAGGANSSKDGTITSNGDYFQIGSNDGQWHYYYIETPTYIQLNNGSGTKNPIGYRIVGAKINYTYGESSVAHQEQVTETVQTGTKEYPTFTISGSVEVWTREQQWINGRLRWVWTSSVTNTYYLTSSAGMSTNEAEKASWFIDEDGYIRLANNPDKYLKAATVSNTTNRLSVVASNESPAKYAIDESGQIHTVNNQGTATNVILSLSVSTQEARPSANNNSTESRVTAVNYFRMIENGTYPAPRTLTGKNKTINTFTTTTSQVTFPAFEPSTFQLKVYDKTGTEVLGGNKLVTNPNDPTDKYIVVDEDTEEDAYVEIPDMNNDAVKIAVKGVGLIQGSLTLQALDPYINRMEIVCSESQYNESQGKYVPIQNGNRLVQTFTASDFSVGGDAFHFYVPETFHNTCLFTFENLYSIYGDESYYNNTESTNNARYSFVMSPYWESNPNLYATTGEEGYETKVIAYLKGDEPYRFNNAGEVGTGGGTVEEYPFSLALYGGASKFSQLTYSDEELTVTTTNPATQKIANLFTCDETRYNISTATATQHRIYAFYKMDITAQKEIFTPEFTWTKIYDSSCYQDGETEKTDAQYGLKLTTSTYANDDEHQYGYLTVSQIVNGINAGVASTGTLEHHTGERPTTKGQILYVDASELLSVMENSETTGEGTNAVTTMHNYTEILNGAGQNATPIGANAIVYLPKQNSTNSVGNFAYGEDGIFTASNDVTLTDKKPFFALYDIYLQEGKYAIYTRNLTDSKYGKDGLASITLPFTLSLTDGKHTNGDGSCAFTVYQLNTNQTISRKSGDDYGTAYFTKLTTAKTEANKPYMILVDGDNVPSDKNISFIAKESTVIKATPNTGDGVTTGTNFTGKLLEGAATSVTFNSTTTFTNYGTFSGANFDRTDNNVFYFANNMYHNMNDLSSKYHLLVYPFRGIYKYPAGVTSREFSLKHFDVSFDEPEYDITSIDDNWKSEADLMVRTDKGSMTLTATKAQEVSIYAANGTLAAKVNLQGGDTQTVSLPSGLYVVNNVKIGVK